MGIESADTFVRPIYAGNAIATVKSLDEIKLFTVRSSAWEAAVVGESSTEVDSAAAEEVGPGAFRNHSLALSRSC